MSAPRHTRRKPGPPPKLYQMRGVRLFASGSYRGEDWPPHVIDELAANARQLGPSGLGMLVPPSVLGHEEDQTKLGEFLERTDHPAAGWVDPATVRSVPDPKFAGHKILVGNVVNIPEPIKEQLERGAYKFGSAEIYDNFRDDFGNEHGHVLRRFALLGGEVPQVKRLGSLPPVEPMAAPLAFSEGRAIRVRRVTTADGRTHLFAETVSMDRNAMIAAITAAMPGLAQTTLDAMSDEALADLMKNLPTGAATADAGAAGPAAPAMQPGAMFAEGDEEDEPAEPSETEGETEGEPSEEEMREALIDMGQDPAEVEAMDPEEVAALYDELMAAQQTDQPAAAMAAGDPTTQTPAAPMNREQMIAELVAAGQDPAALESMTDEQLMQMLAQLQGGGAAAPAAGAPAQPMAAMSDRGRRRCGPQRPAATFGDRDAAALAREAETLRGLITSETARLQRQRHAAKREDATRFCEQLVADGKFTKAQADTVVLPLLLGLDETNRIHRHNDGGGTKSVSAYELKKAQLARIPAALKFGERVGAGRPATTKSVEVNKVRRFSETVPDSALRAAGKTREQMVKDFEEMLAKKPDLRAEDYLGVTSV